MKKIGMMVTMAATVLLLAAQVGVAQETFEYPNTLTLSNVQIQDGMLMGEIQNTGEMPIKSVELTVFFMDQNNQVVGQDKVKPLQGDGGMMNGAMQEDGSKQQDGQKQQDGAMQKDGKKQQDGQKKQEDGGMDGGRMMLNPGDTQQLSAKVKVPQEWDQQTGSIDVKVTRLDFAKMQQEDGGKQQDGAMQKDGQKQQDGQKKQDGEMKKEDGGMMEQTPTQEPGMEMPAPEQKQGM